MLLPFRNISLAYLFENTNEAIRFVVQRPLTEGLGYREPALLRTQPLTSDAWPGRCK